MIMELAFVIMKAKKPHDLPSAIWRTRKVSGVIQSQSEGPKSQGANGVSPSSSPKAQEWRWGEGQWHEFEDPRTRRANVPK